MQKSNRLLGFNSSDPRHPPSATGSKQLRLCRNFPTSGPATLCAPLEHHLKDAELRRSTSVPAQGPPADRFTLGNLPATPPTPPQRALLQALTWPSPADFKWTVDEIQKKERKRGQYAEMSDYQQETQTPKHRRTMISRRQETGSHWQWEVGTETCPSYWNKHLICSLQTPLWLAPSATPRLASSGHLCRLCPPGPLGGVQVPAPISKAPLSNSEMPMFPKYTSFEVVLIYLHCGSQLPPKA